MPLPAPLAQFAQFRQFVAVRLVPDAARPGKTNKIPINPNTLGAASSTDPASWSDYDAAAATGLPVGFVLTESDPLWCLDIDGTLEHPLVAAFPGAAVEVSQSGNGLHIWGCGTPPVHKCKNTAHGIELYHKERFICLGDPASATGNAWQDFTAHLAAVVPDWFPPSTSIAGGTVEWTDGPRADWRGSVDDAELIRRARESRSAGAIFGGKAAFDDLWCAKADVLAASYPTTTDAPWGQSEADRALAQHLAFWTGCNCERMLAIMKQSALVREKWDREDYLERTILSAVADCRDVCRDKAAPIAEVIQTAPMVAGHTMPAPVAREAATFVRLAEYPVIFGGCVYVQTVNRVFVPHHTELLSPDAFRVLFGGIKYALDDMGEKFEGDAWKAFTQCATSRPPHAKGTCFRPDLPHGALVNIQGDAYVNTYLPAQVDATPGDVTPFLTHLAKLLPEGDDRAKFLAWMAAVVQYPGRKFSWAPLMQGAPGNGKTLFSMVLREAVGHKYTSSPTKKQLEKEFNSWMDGKIFVYIEDIMVRRDLLEELKPVITGEVAPIERKGVDAESRAVCCNFLFNCNPKDGVPKTADDRRIAPFYTAQQCPEHIERDGMGGDYFPVLYDWLKHQGGFGAVTHYLRTYAIPNELNPATVCVRAPVTTSTAEAISRSLGPVEQAVAEAIEEGRVGFKGDFVSSHFLDVLLKDRRHDIALTKRRDLMASLGYVPHPSLPGGRTNNVVLPDGVKPRLYVCSGSIAALAAAPVEVARIYTAAQMELDA